MLSVTAHLTSLAFALWTAYCIWLYVMCRVGLFYNNDLYPVIWVLLAVATGVFFLMR